MPRYRMPLLAGLVLAAVLGPAAAADAHVTVTPSSTVAGDSSTLTFSVANESDSASTTALTVQLPQRPPFTSVLTQAVPGWTVRTSTTELPTSLQDPSGGVIGSAVTRVVWTATAGGIRPGQFGTFALSVGPLPAGTLFLPTVQHYSDGTEVGWVQQAQGDARPRYPAPSVVVGTAAGDLTAPAAGRASDTGTGLGSTVALPVLALLAGAVGGAVAGGLFRRRAAASAAIGAGPVRTGAGSVLTHAEQ